MQLLAHEQLLFLHVHWPSGQEHCCVSIHLHSFFSQTHFSSEQAHFPFGQIHLFPSVHLHSFESEVEHEHSFRGQMQAFSSFLELIIL